MCRRLGLPEVLENGPGESEKAAFEKPSLNDLSFVGCESIRFSTGNCALGTLLAASSDRGVCGILLGDGRDVVRESLRKFFPRASLIENDIDSAKVIARIIRFLETPESGLDLTLDVRGSAFQRDVWQALCRIPAGMTASYAEIATEIGRPGAERAVAGACAANRLAIAIPCHRVIRKDGGLSGYRWGVARKRELLQREKVRTPLR